MSSQRSLWSALVGVALWGLTSLDPSNVAGAATHPVARVRQIETPLGCVETVVTVSRPPSGPSMADGGRIEFRNDVTSGQHINEVYVPPGDDPIADVGERVRVCLLSVPKKTPGPHGCDPARDIRGRELLVYVYTSDPDRQSHNAAVYTNTEHWCGGA